MSQTEGGSDPTELTDGQWQVIRRLLPSSCRKGTPRTVCRPAVINAIYDVLRTSCAWRSLPQNSPKLKTVYGIFLAWRKDGTWRKTHDSLRDTLRRQEGRIFSPSLAIIGSQTVKITEAGSERRYDAGKKVSGGKWHITTRRMASISKSGPAG